MADYFQSERDDVFAPALWMFAITPDDNNDLAILPKAIRCDVGGTVVLIAANSGSTAVSITMSAGEVLPVRAKRVKATGTTATLHGLA